MVSVSFLQSPISLQKSPISLQKSPISLQKSPISLQKSPISLQQSPISLQKSPISLKKSPISLQRKPISPQKSSVSLQKSPVYLQKSPTSSQRVCVHSYELHDSITRVTWLIHDAECIHTNVPAKRCHRSSLPPSMCVCACVCVCIGSYVRQDSYTARNVCRNGSAKKCRQSCSPRSQPVFQTSSRSRLYWNYLISSKQPNLYPNYIISIQTS